MFFQNLHLKSLNLGDFLIKIDVPGSTRSASAAFLGRKCFVPLQTNKSSPETRYACRNFKNYMTFHLKKITQKSSLNKGDFLLKIDLPRSTKCAGAAFLGVDALLLCK